jgi:hypothetical protein
MKYKLEGDMRLLLSVVGKELGEFLPGSKGLRVGASGEGSSPKVCSLNIPARLKSGSSSD